MRTSVELVVVGQGCAALSRWDSLSAAGHGAGSARWHGGIRCHWRMIGQRADKVIVVLGQRGGKVIVVLEDGFFVIINAWGKRNYREGFEAAPALQARSERGSAA